MNDGIQKLVIIGDFFVVVALTFRQRKQLEMIE
jgi:hypothetical protein